MKETTGSVLIRDRDNTDIFNLGCARDRENSVTLTCFPCPVHIDSIKELYGEATYLKAKAIRPGEWDWLPHVQSDDNNYEIELEQQLCVAEKESAILYELAVELLAELNRSMLYMTTRCSIHLDDMKILKNLFTKANGILGDYKGE